jgi:hypothetical protein
MPDFRDREEPEPFEILVMIIASDSSEDNYLGTIFAWFLHGEYARRFQEQEEKFNP